MSAKKNRIFIYQEKGTYTRKITVIAKDEEAAYEKVRLGHPSNVEGEPILEPQGRPEYVQESD